MDAESEGEAGLGVSRLGVAEGPKASLPVCQSLRAYVPGSALGSGAMEVPARVFTLSPYHSAAVLHSPQGIGITYYPRDIVNVFSEQSLLIFLNVVRFSQPCWSTQLF